MLTLLLGLIGLVLGGVIITLAALYISQARGKLDATARAKRAGATLPPMVPGSLPLLGHLLTMMKHLDGIKFFEFMEEHRKVFGNVFRMYRGWPLNINLIYVNDPECVKHFLSTNFDNYQRGPHRKRIMSPLLGDGIFTASGEHWKVQRDTARPLFKISNLERMIPVFIKHAEMVTKKLEQTADSGEELEIQQIFWRFTLDSIGQIAFGYNIDSLHDNNIDFALAFDRAQRTIDRHFSLSFLRFIPSAENRQLARDAKLIDDFAYRVIRETRTKLATTPNDAAEAPSLLESFMELRDDTNGGTPFSDKYLRDIVLNFVIAGRDTTSNLLTWTTYLVAQHPEVQRKLFEEVSQYFPDSGRDLEASGNILKNLKYTEMVLEETLRLYPSVPIDGRQAVDDDILPNGLFVPKHSGVIYSAYVLHRIKEFWGEDAEEFNPERFSENHSTKNKMHPFQYVPFHGGPQRCLGQKMAIMEAKVMCAYLFRNFEVSLVPDHVVEPVRAITFPARTGVKVTLKRRA